VGARDAELGIDSAALLNALVDAVVVASDTGTIIYVNPSAERLLGEPSTVLVGLPLVAIIPERLRAQHTEGFGRYVRTRTPRLIGGPPVRLPVLRADGSEVEIELSLSAHGTTAGAEVFAATLRDLGDRLELERQRAISRYLTTSRDVMTRLAVGAAAATLEEAAPVLLEALGEGLRWDGGAVWSVADGRLRPLVSWAPPGDQTAVIMTSGVELAVGQGLPGTVAQNGEAMWIETVAADTVFVRRDQAERAGLRSCFAFPIFVGGEVPAVVEMYSRAVQPPEPEFLAVLQAAGTEIGRYLERAQSRRHLVDMAEALQASLLPPHSPTVPGLDVAVRYHAASGEGQVGGDFFDVFPLPDGEWAVLIGDVAGRGPRAAALTALARYTLRAAAIGATTPSSVLQVLNDVVRRELDASYQGDERFLTVAYLVIKPGTGGYEVKIACGGHPYPLARRADGTVEEVPCEGDLIGAFEVHEATDRVVELSVDDALVLVTDGVLEARHGGVELGEEGLRQLIAASRAADASGLADEIEQAVLAYLGGNPKDDLAIVVLRMPEVVEVHSSSIDLRVADLT
jgi:phosphoserine phosphatase RsbU/P